MANSRDRWQSGRSRVMLLVVAALAAVAALVFWIVRDGHADHQVAALSAAAPIEPATPADELVRARAEDARNSSGAALEHASANGFEIPVGVRVAGPGRLKGRVRDRATGSGVSGARVDLLPLPPGGAQVFGRMLRLADIGDEVAKRVEPIAVAASGADGEFSFEGVRTGSYFVEARTALAVPDQTASARVTSTGDGGPIDVFVRAGGRVLGRVLSADRKPAAGAKLALTAGATNLLDAARRGDLCYLEAVADANGAFSIGGVPAGEGWELTASDAGLTLSHRGELAVRAGADTQVELIARAGATIRGRVLSVAKDGESNADAAPTPLAGAHVGAVPRGLRDLLFVEEVLRATHAVTDAEGRYVMEHVPPGEVDVLAIAPGHLPAKGPNTWVADRATSDVSDFELTRGALVTGRVVDSAGAPIEGVQVRWNMIDAANFQFDFTLAPLLAQAVKGFEYPRTDVDGRFSAGPFPGAPPFSMDFWKTGYRNATAKWDPKSSSELTVTLTRGGAVEGIVMDAVKHEPVKSFNVSGNDRIDVATDAPGKLNPFAGGELFESPDGRFRVDSVAPGKVTLDFSAPGYLATSVDELEVTEGETTRGVIVELYPGATITGLVVDKEHHPVAGAQVFASTESSSASAKTESPRRGRRLRPNSNGGLDGAPPGVTHYLVALGFLGDRATSTRPDGSFVLTGVEPGKVTVTAVHRDFVPTRSEPVEVTVDAPAKVEIALSSGGGVFGTVSDRFDRPVVNAIVLAMAPGNIDRNGGALYQGRSDESGKYKIEHMSSGGYFLVLTRGDEALNPMSFMSTLKFDFVSVPASDSVRFDLKDESSGAARVYGRVSADGVAADRGNIVAINFESEGLLGVDFKMASVHAGGGYEFPGLAPGTYRFKLSQIGIGTRSLDSEMELEIPDQPQVQLDLALPTGGIQGRIVDAATHAAVRGAEVVLVSPKSSAPSGLFGKLMAQGDAIRASSDEQGAYHFEHLQAGRYALSVRPPHFGQGAHFAPSKVVEVRVAENAIEHGVDVVLDPALVLRGTVKGADGSPVENAQILARARDSSEARVEHATSRADGGFEIDYLAPGTYDISASADGYAAEQQKGVALARGEEKTLELVLPRGVRVRVRVYSADGTPISGAAATLTSKSGQVDDQVADLGQSFSNLFSGKGVSDTNGVLELGQFGPGAYVLDVRRALSHATQAVELQPSSDEVELHVTLH